MRPFGLHQIAQCNLWRRKTRAVIVALGLVAAAATITSVAATISAARSEIARQMDEYGANLVVVPDTADLLLSYGGVELSTVSSDVAELSEDDAAKIRTIRRKENINIVAPKLLGVAEVEGHRTVVVGVRFDAELNMRRWWVLRGHRPGPNETLVGSEVARLLNLGVGDPLRVNGRTLNVAAVLEPTGTQEDALVYADLTAVQQMLGKPGRVSVIEVSAWCAACPIETIVMQIRAKLPQARVTAVKQAVNSKLVTLDTLSRFAGGLSVVVLLASGLMVVVTMMASVHDRAREIGVMRAIGFRRRHIVQVILTEALIIGLAGGIAGYLVGMALAIGLGSKLVNLTVTITWDPALAIQALGLSVVLGLLGGLFPAWRAARMDPVDALRAL